MKYTDEDGRTWRGLTAMLWITVSDDRSKNTKLRVHPGHTFTVNDRAFEVTAIDADVVQLDVRDVDSNRH